MSITYFFSLIAGLAVLIVLSKCRISRGIRKIIGTAMLVIGIVFDLATKEEMSGISLLQFFQTFFACTGIAILFGLLYERWENRSQQTKHG